jgi:hypothetical protein
MLVEQSPHNYPHILILRDVTDFLNIIIKAIWVDLIYLILYTNSLCSEGT